MPKFPVLKKIAAVLVLVLLPFLLTACFHSPGQKAVTLKYWGLWEAATTVNRAVEDYKKDSPTTTVVYEKKSREKYRESLESQIESGKGPDIFVFHNTWTPMLKEELDPVPADVVSQSEFKKDFFPTVFFDLRNNNKQFVGVPVEFDGLALFYNEDIFKAAGTTKPPATWEELARTAARLTVQDTSGNLKTAGVALGTAGNVDHFSDILALMILQNGGDLATPTDKRTADALEYYVNFTKGPNRVWDETMPASTVAFAGGNLAMYFAPSWRAIEIKNANPLLKFKTAPVPQLSGGKIAWASYWAVGVSGKSTNKKEAWNFVRHLVKPETLITLYSEAAKSPGRFFGEPYPRVSLAAKLATDPLVGAYVADAPFARSFPLASRTFDNGINDQLIKAYEDAINSVLKGTTAVKALETTAKNVANILGRYGR